MNTQLFRIDFYVPQSHLEEVKRALFEAGAGRVGDYDSCAWQTRGTGQFQPGADTSPFIGSAGAMEIVEEYKVELVCQSDCLASAIAALKDTHPYEEPAYSVIRMESV